MGFTAACKARVTETFASSSVPCACGESDSNVSAPGSPGGCSVERRAGSVSEKSHCEPRVWKGWGAGSPGQAGSLPEPRTNGALLPPAPAAWSSHNPGPRDKREGCSPSRAGPEPRPHVRAGRANGRAAK